jgi:UPF0176 protein
MIHANLITPPDRVTVSVVNGHRECPSRFRSREYRRGERPPVRAGNDRPPPEQTTKHQITGGRTLTCVDPAIRDGTMSACWRILVFDRENATMRRAVLALGITAALTTACSVRPSEPAPTTTPAPPPPTTAVVAVPPDPQPTGAGPCPYLTTTFVADANGQHVSKVQTSAEQPHPACFFYALTGKLQLTVRVYTGDQAVAKALVDKAAPIDTSDPATDPPGWQGGYQSTDDGAVYAVAKGGAAVIVTTNQKQTVKARTVAKQAISALAL